MCHDEFLNKSRYLWDEISLLICVFDKDLNIIFANKAYCECFGKSFDELKGKNWLGVKCEFLLYGNVLLKYGRSFPTDCQMHKNKPLGIKLLGKSQEVYSYRGLQHE